ncbi:hypothetical protein DID77_03705 [Candidatus Marinamargulisbacteria bacterium SCGC AG-439-L15]|nr:hypothetical protein DID77_03705 [Candidatus Marinamargulisbacteria bacterium SCGC AG-439-L15]
MKKEKLIFIASLYFGLALILGPSYAEEKTEQTLYIKSMQTNIHSQSAPSSPIITTLKRGEKVQKIDEKKPWIKIKTSSHEGWVHGFAVSKSAPQKRVSILAQKQDIASSARKRARTFTSAAAARGLAESGKKSIRAKQLPDYESLSKLEDTIIDEVEAVRFIYEKE